jgi:hypothetical protein
MYNYEVTGYQIEEKYDYDPFTKPCYEGEGELEDDAL